MRRILLFLFLPSILFAANDLVKLTNMRINPSSNATRFQFLLSGKTCGNIKYYSNPARVVLDLQNTTKDFEIKDAKLGGANVSVVNAEEIKDNHLQFTFTTTGPVTWDLQVFPYGKDKKQVVLQIDLISLTPQKITTPKGTDKTGTFGK